MSPDEKKSWDDLYSKLSPEGQKEADRITHLLNSKLFEAREARRSLSVLIHGGGVPSALSKEDGRLFIYRLVEDLYPGGN